MDEDPDTSRNRQVTTMARHARRSACRGKDAFGISGLHHDGRLMNAFDGHAVDLATNTEKLKILHICESAKGGVGTYLNTLWLIEQDRFNSRFVVPDSHRPHLDTDMPVVTFSKKKRGLKPILNLSLSSLKEAKKWNPDIIFFHSSFALFSLIFLRLFLVKSKFIYCPHGWASCRQYNGRWRKKFILISEKLLANFANFTVNISQHDYNYSKSNNFFGNHVLIENATPDVTDVKSEEVFRKSKNQIDILFVGRFDRQKGLDILLDAFQASQSIRSDLTLHIVGAPVLEENFGRSLKEQKSIKFYGWIPKEGIDRFYRSADLLVVPSRWEGFGLVVPEALRNGTPVLVSDRGGLPDLVVEGKTGFVFPLDCVQLARCLSQLDRASLRAMRATCRKSYEARFGVDRFASQIVEMYRDLSGSERTED